MLLYLVLCLACSLAVAGLENRLSRKFNAGAAPG